MGIQNNARFFAAPENFIKLIAGENVNIIELGYLYNGKASAAEIGDNRVFCSFRGEELEQVSAAELDESDNENKFAYETVTGTNKNVIKIAVVIFITGETRERGKAEADT